MKTFKIQRTNDTPWEVQGKLVADATGSHFYIQVIQSTVGFFVLVIGNYRDDWQVVHPWSTYSGLMHVLTSFATEPMPATVKSLLIRHPHDPLLSQQEQVLSERAHQDLLETVDVVRQEIGNHAERIV